MAKGHSTDPSAIAAAPAPGADGGPGVSTRAPTVPRLASAILRFRRRESGAVTVDWVVLTAAMLGLAIVALNAAGGGVADASTDVKKCLKRQKNVLLKKDGWDYDKRMRVAARRCGRL